MQIAAGNVYSDVQKIHVGSGGTVKLRINKVIPPNPRPQDTEWVKHMRIQSQKLTAFWGRPVYIYATVLLPKGYNEHPNVKYPTVYTFGHNVPFSFTSGFHARARTRADQSGDRPRDGIRLLQVVDLGWIPAIHCGELRAGDAVVPRLVLGQLGAERSVRRRDGAGGHSGSSRSNSG